MNTNFSNSIKHHRKERGLTQEQLAEALGVTVGAVYKWESGQSMPEIKLLIDIALFFDTSVDVLLDYGWENSSMGRAAEQIKELRANKRLTDAARLAEQALQKYPNSFDVVYQSALTYLLMMEESAASRAIALFEKACRLIDQNKDEEITVSILQNRIAECYIHMKKYDKAVELLKANNAFGINNSLIGQLLSLHCNRPREALHYLSDAMRETHRELFQTVVGYVNAYVKLGQLDQAADIIRWGYSINKGLCDDGTTYMDKENAMLLVALAEVQALQNDTENAYIQLKQAAEIARRFDASPNYTMTGLRFYHGPDAVAFDDFGETAMEGIERSIADDGGTPHLRSIWEQIRKESASNEKSKRI